MSQIFESSVFFGVFISLSSYIFGIWLKKKTGWALANPLLVSIILVIATLSLLGVSYESYARGAEIIKSPQPSGSESPKNSAATFL